MGLNDRPHSQFDAPAKETDDGSHDRSESWPLCRRPAVALTDIGRRNARHELTSWNREQYHVPDYPLALPVTAASPHDAGFSVYTDGLFGWLTLRSRFDTRFRYDGSHERELHPSAVA